MVQKVILKAANRAPRVVTVGAAGALTVLGSDSNVIVYNSAASIASATITLPAAVDVTPGKEINIGFATAVTTLSWSAGAGTSFLKPAPTTQALNTALRFILDAANRWCLC